MFTGIIEDLGKVSIVDQCKDYWKISIKSKFDDINIGDSISVNGVCLTVAMIKNGRLYFDIVSETLEKSNLKLIKNDESVNLERCLRLNDRLDGHLVQGHIECTGKILSKSINEGETKLEISLNDSYLKYCIYKGSIAVDGVSLTIAKLNSNSIEISIIPHTLKHTTLGIKNVGSLVNIETDMISKYIERNLQYKN